jgi:hypothetical protein
MAMSTKTLKRTTVSKPSTSKRAKVTKTPVEKRVDIVMHALASEETVVPEPTSCRSMLVSAAPVALKVPKDERHADQEAMFAMLNEIFGAEKARWEIRVAHTSSVGEKATAEQKEKLGLKEAADAALKAQKEVVHAKYEARSKAEEVVADCKEEVSASMALLADSQVTRDDIFKNQETDLALQETITGLKEGSYDDTKELKKHITAVTALLRSLGAEDALVKTLPQILRCKPEERGSFDVITLQQLDSYMKAHLEYLHRNLEGTDKIIAEHATAVTAWEAAVQVAEDKKKESDEAVDVASAQQDELQKGVSDARKLLKEQVALVKRCNADHATEQCGLQSVQEVLEALAFLQEYIAPVPEKECEEDIAKQSEQMAREMPVESETVAANLVPTAKAKEIDVAMNLDDVPSPSKKARVSLGGAPTTLVM